MSDSPPPCFFDTNILIYAVAEDHPERTAIAQDLVRRMADAGLARVSTQTLQEFYVTATLKVQKRLSSDQALRYLEQMARWGPLTLDYPIVREAALLSQAHRLSFWDSLIIVAAARSGARRLYTEDLQHGRKIFGVEIVNPFRD
jgi:predicted nucleic acid-binding protein